MMQPNRSERRAIIKAEAKQLKKEGKKLVKNGKFNSKKSLKSIGFKKSNKDSHITGLYSASESTDTFTVEYIHLFPEYDDSQEDDSDADDTTIRKLTSQNAKDQAINTTVAANENLNVILLDESPSPSIVCEDTYFENQLDTPDKSTVLLGCTTEAQELNSTDGRSMRSTKSLKKHKQHNITRPLVLTEDESKDQTGDFVESAIGCDGSENQCTFLSLSEDVARPVCDTSNKVADLAILEVKPSSVSSVSTVSVLEEKVEKSRSIYNHESPFPSGETLKPSGKKKNVFYRVFRKKSEKIFDKFTAIKVTEDEKKRSWKIWKKLLRRVS